MIQKLSEKLIKQIAAGEVISRPCNALKELIENSIDAGSSKIEIFLKNHGLNSIIIIDNGTGFEEQDLKIATQMHTTSKTFEDDQIFGKNFLGFRGEALASIDAISDLSIESNQLKFNKNKISHSNVKYGTKIEIKNIFQNVPARLKFIKNSEVEFKYIKESIKKYIIKYNEIEWTIFHNEKKLWHFEKNSQKERIEKIFKDESIFFENSIKNIKIFGYILKKTHNISIIYANKRPIKDKIILKYITSLFKEYTFINENPGYILFIEIDDMFIDYNVHPAKEEVKFLNYQEIFRIIASSFGKNLLANKLNQNEHLIFEENIIKPESKSDLNKIVKPKFQENFELNFINESSNNDFDNKIKEQVPLFKIIGQFQNSFILFENENGLGIFDQHAAAEREIYEKMKEELSENFIQKTLTPIELNLNFEQKEFLKENLLVLKSKGIIIKNFKIEYIPLTLKNLNFKEFFEKLIPPFDYLTEIHRLVANIACKNALKANTELSILKMHNLLDISLKNPPVCNHGRPVFKYFNNNEIKNFFKRT